MEFNAPSLANIAIMQVAIQITNNPEISKEIFCLSSSEYSARKDVYISRHMFRYGKIILNEMHLKQLWHEILERKTKILIGKICITKEYQEKLIGTVLLLGMKMLKWAGYHMKLLKISHPFTNINFLSSCFNHRGIIDCKRAATFLMKDENLSCEQKYKLACIYCFVEDIHALYKLISEEDREVRHNFPAAVPNIVEFWTLYCRGEIEKFTDSENIYECMLYMALDSGSLAAVDYAIKRINFSKNPDILVEAALEAIKHFKYIDDIQVFVFHLRINLDSSWKPSDYYVEIMYFLFVKMTKSQQTQFLHREAQNYSFPCEGWSKVLELFLGWPYQDCFMKAVKILGRFLSHRVYLELLLKISVKISSELREYETYGEEKCYNYWRLLIEFWCETPQSLKRNIFTNKEFNDKNEVSLFHGIAVLSNLFAHKPLTDDHMAIIRLILSSATNEEKEIIIYSPKGKRLWLKIFMNGYWVMLDEIIHIFQLDKNVNELKKLIYLSDIGLNKCVKYIKNDNWDGFETFIRWTCLSEDEIHSLKKDIAAAMLLQLNDIPDDKIVKVFGTFCTWCFYSDEDVKEFKKSLAYSSHTCRKILYFFESQQSEFADKIVNFCFSTEEEVKKLKRYIAEQHGSQYCEYLILEIRKCGFYCSKCAEYPTCKLKRNRWEEVMKFLTWCFSSEEEINIFKKKYLFEKRGENICADLEERNHHDEVETFCSWLDLSCDEIKHLKDRLSDRAERNRRFQARLAAYRKVFEMFVK